jgi:hypothetical protein
VKSFKNSFWVLRPDPSCFKRLQDCFFFEGGIPYVLKEWKEVSFLDCKVALGSVHEDIQSLSV